MAKHNRTSKRDDDTDLEDMRDAFKRHKERPRGGAGKSDWDKLKDGKNMRRVLPRPNLRKFYTEGWTHFDVGPNNRAVRCIDEDGIDVERGLPKPGTKCPMCKKFLKEQDRVNGEYAKGDKEGHAEWKRVKDRYAARHQYYANVLRVDEEDEENVEVKILAFGAQVWGALMNYYLGDDTNIGDFTDPEGGRWLNIKKNKKGGRDRRNVGYEVFPATDTEDISDSWDDIKEALHDLDAAVGKILTKDEVIAIQKGLDKKDDEDDDSGSDDDSSRSRRRGKSRRDDDEEEEEESDDDGGGDDSSEEEDDDDDRPVRTKSSKLSKKMKRRRDDD